MVDLPRRKRAKQPGLERRFERGEFIPIVVRTKQGNITIRVGRLANGNFCIDAPRATCDIILPERRPNNKRLTIDK